MKVTVEQVKYWIGSDTQMSEIFQILAELANGEYDAEQMRQDIINTNDEGEE
jgi:hypothetical protein